MSHAGQATVNRLAEQHDDSDDEETLVKEVIRLVRNDDSPIPQVQIMDDEFEELHFEDTYQTNRLNKDPDINDISVHQLMSILETFEFTTATIRAMKSQVLYITLQLDSGANRSVTPHKNLLHNI